MTGRVSSGVVPREPHRCLRLADGERAARRGPRPAAVVRPAMMWAPRQGGDMALTQAPGAPVAPHTRGRVSGSAGHQHRRRSLDGPRLRRCADIAELQERRASGPSRGSSGRSIPPGSGAATPTSATSPRGPKPRGASSARRSSGTRYTRSRRPSGVRRMAGRPCSSTCPSTRPAASTCSRMASDSTVS